MKKTELLERVGAAHAKLVGALEGLTEEQAARVGLNAEWSVKDALAHITAWEGEGVRVLGEILQGTWQPRKFDKQAIDDFNARATEERRHHPFEQLRGEFDAAHRRMTDTLSALPDEIDEASPEYKFTEAVTFRHMASHGAQIEEWKEKMMNAGG